jgi:hypothetical protein
MRFKCGSGTFRMNVALPEVPSFTALPGKKPQTSRRRHHHRTERKGIHFETENDTEVAAGYITWRIAQLTSMMSRRSVLNTARAVDCRKRYRR